MVEIWHTEDIKRLIFETCQERGVEAEFVVVKDRGDKVLDIKIGVKGRVSPYSDCQFLTLKAGRDLRKLILEFLIRYDFV